MRKLARLRKEQRGYALVWVLVLLIVSGLVLIPLLLLMATGITSSDVRAESTQRFYAADAGIEAAIRQLMQRVETDIDFDLNGSSVHVDITPSGAGDTFVITSTATSDGRTTVIVSQLSAETYDLFQNAISSLGGVTIRAGEPPGATINGTVQCNGTLDNNGTINGDAYAGALNNNGSITGETGTQEIYDWQWVTPQALSDRYCGTEEICSLPAYTSDTIDVDTNPTIGPLYRNGSLKIKSMLAGAISTLNGTVYVSDDLDMGKTNQPFTLDLNNKTIYVEGNIKISDKVTFTGSGVIVALGNIDFGPQIQATPPNEPFIFVMSVNGTITFQPKSDFYGSLAGNVEIQLQPGNNLTLTAPPEDEEGRSLLDFPAIVVRATSDILTYTIE